MSLDLPGTQEPIDEPPLTPERLVQELRDAEKPPAQHRLGLEHEKFVYPQASVTPVPYEGKAGIEALLGGLAKHWGDLFREAPGHPAIAILRGDSTVSLEPGGQLELSGSAAASARTVHDENVAHVKEVREVAGALGLRMVALGYRPFGTREENPWMPKTRYQVMRDTLGKRGALALDMMLMTATGQVSLDWESEEDCARKLTLLSRVAPLLVALYANSPLVHGKPSPYLSFRSKVWTATDDARCGFFPSMLDGSFRYRDYVDWALAAPLLFLRRDGKYVSPALTFRQLMEQGYQGVKPTMQDWRDHLSTLFPEVRLKRVMEVRSADCVNVALTGALAAFLRGLVYEPGSLSDALALLPALPFEQHLARMETARREGLRNAELHGMAREVVALAGRGLQRLDPRDLPVLEPLVEVAESGRAPAERVLEVFEKTRDPRAVLDAFTL